MAAPGGRADNFVWPPNSTDKASKPVAHCVPRGARAGGCVGCKCFGINTGQKEKAEHKRAASDAEGVKRAGGKRTTIATG